MPFAVYASVYSLALCGLVGLSLGGMWTWLLPLVVFGLIPPLELLLSPSRQNAAPEAEAARRKDRRFDLLLYAIVPVPAAMILLLAYGAPTYTPLALVGAIVATGTALAALGINVAHELGHRPDRTHQRVARVLLGLSLYAHFFVEHNRGHHARVATPDDPASARRGEPVYTFWVRTLVGSWKSAWKLESDRLGRKGRSPWTLSNEIVVGLLAQAALVTGIFAGFGVIAGLSYLAACAFSILMLETINYVEHYGLSRQRGADGRWERVRPAHSWTSDQPISRAILFDLTRHADHHANPGRPYAALRHFEDAPELPTGYAGMVLLALVPPVFCAVMDRHIDSETTRLAPLQAPA